MDVLIEQADEEDGGYMASDQKVTGVLLLPDWEHDPRDYGNDIERDLYKGGIRDLFHETADL